MTFGPFAFGDPCYCKNTEVKKNSEKRKSEDGINIYAVDDSGPWRV